MSSLMRAMTLMTTRSRWWARVALLSLAAFSGRAAGSRAAEGDDTATAARVKGSVTFNKDIAPLVFQHCSTCHRPGEVAPFPLLSYRDMSKRAELVRTVIEERT